MNTFAWLVRREFWENRAIWIVPSVFGATLVLASLIGHVHLDFTLSTFDQHRVVGGTALLTLCTIFLLPMSIYASWYLLDCLYADRKDRSILFWKSLPITDTATVLAKLFTGIIAIPLVYFAAADLTTLLLSVILTARLHSALGMALWQADIWLQLQVLWLYLIVTSAVWYLPFAGWFLLVSAYAKRAVVLLSLAVPLGLHLLERWFVGTRLIGSAIAGRAFGYPAQAFRNIADHHGWVTTIIDNDPVTAPANVWQLLDPAGFISSPATWAGVFVGAAFTAGAIALRTRRSEM